MKGIPDYLVEEHDIRTRLNELAVSGLEIEEGECAVIYREAVMEDHYGGTSVVHCTKQLIWRVTSLSHRWHVKVHRHYEGHNPIAQFAYKDFENAWKTFTTSAVYFHVEEPKEEVPERAGILDE